MKLRAASFFAGVGGIELGFQDHIDLVYANEFNDKAIKTYNENFDCSVDYRDIRSVNASEIPDFDLMLAGFPCQAFSVAGYREGFNDKKGRGNLFFELERIFKTKKPSVVFLENVKNLVGHDNGRTFQTILKILESNGYFVKYKVLNPVTHGCVPQNRERIYIVGFKNKVWYDNFHFPEPTNDKDMDLLNYIDFDKKVDDKYYYNENNFKHFSLLSEEVNEKGAIYQWRRKYVRKNKNGVCPTLTANMGTGGHNVPIIYTKHGIRKLTPSECFKLQGFPDNYKLPEDVSNTHLYQQAGNSVCVSVIKRISDNIAKAISSSQNSALIIVDMQKDFYVWGSLEVKKSDQILEPINRLINWFNTKKQLVVATQDLHPSEHISFNDNEKIFATNPDLKKYWDANDHWPKHCVIGTNGQTFVDGLNTQGISRVFYKGTDLLTDAYSVFSNTNKNGDNLDCDKYLKSHNITHIYLCGLAMDYCVYYTAMDAVKLGYQVTLVTDATVPVDCGELDKIKHNYSQLGVDLITSQQLCE